MANLGLLKNLLDAAPPDEKRKYIFLVAERRKEMVSVIDQSGYIGITVANKVNDEEKRDVAGLIDLLTEAAFNRPDIKNEYTFVTCCRKADNDALAEAFKGGGFIFLPGWKLFKGLPEDTSEETKYILAERIKAFLSTSQAQREQARQTAVDLTEFHTYDQYGHPKGVHHDAVYQYIKHKYDLFVMGGIVYIYNGGVYKPDVSGARLKTLIRSFIYPQFVKSTTINNIFALFLMDSDLEKTFDEINNYPAYWINFQNGFYDPKVKKMVLHSPEYLSINQLPHCFKPSARPEGKVVEEWLQFIAPKEDDREMILQFAGYCLGRDVSQQKFMILNGEGGSGKSTLIHVIEEIIGPENISNISLTELQQRFASFGLMGKLLNSCADLEIAALEDTSVLKKSLGEDRLRAEQKGHDAISFKSYAKMIFSTNELPTVRAERTNGFYRRLLIMTMNRTPTRKRADFFDALHDEIDYFIHISVAALERMYEAGQIAESQASVEAINQMKLDSDTVEAWLQEVMYRVPGSKLERSACYSSYEQYCKDNERQALLRTSFYKAMRSKGYSEYRTSAGRYFNDISFEKSVTESVIDQEKFIEVSKQEELPFP